MGEQFGRYRLDQRLGQGGMGVVYKAWDPVLERVVALKMVLAEAEMESDVRERFLREARSAAQLTHRNIVTVYDLGEHEGRPFLAMEFLEGEDLQKRLARAEKASLARKLAIAVEICHGVEFAHAHGVVHRDLKPGNIFITTSGGVKILDFGLARFMSSQLTQSNMLLGTINYMSPEQVRGERADQQSDVFSIGVVLYELFSGHRAFEGDSAASTLYKILQEFPRPLWKIDSGLPADLIAIIDRALAKPRDERYPDMASLRRDLEFLQSAATLAGPSTPWPSTAMTLPATPRGGVPLPPLQPAAPAAATPLSAPAPGAAADATVVLGARVAPQSAPSAALPPVSGPATPVAASGRGFWVGAGAGALAIAVLVVWMANRPLPPSSTVSPKAASTEPALPQPTPPTPSAAAPRPPAPTETATRTAEAAQPPAPERRTAPKRASTEPGPTAGRANPRSDATVATAEPRSERPAPPATPAAGPPPSEPASPPRATTAAPTTAAPTIATPPTAAPAAQPAPSAASTGTASPAATSPSTASPVASSAPAAEVAAMSPERANALLQRYKAALEARSLEQLKRLWPSLDDGAEAAIRQEFQRASRITVDISDPQVSGSASAGRIVFLRHYTVTVDGQHLQSTSQATMEVRRSGDLWLIDSIRFSPR